MILYGSLLSKGTSSLVCDPALDVSALELMPGIKSWFRRGDHMTKFPLGMDVGKGPGHFGRAFTFESLADVERCLQVLEESHFRRPA